MSRLLKASDIELFYSGAAGHPFISELKDVAKAAGGITTSLGASVFNPVYGAQVWTQLNQEANLFGILPKVTWSRSGWRVITSLSTTVGSGGVGEDDVIPNPNRPEVQAIKTSPKQVVHTFDTSMIMQKLSELGADDVWGNIEEIKMYFGYEHRRHINAMLGTDVDTPAGNNFESIDRVVSGYPEVGLVDTPTDVNIYGIDRSTAASWADAYVDHNNGTTRTLTDQMIRDMLSALRERGANTTVLVTGYDTYANIQGLYMNFVRYQPISEGNIQVGLNGIQTAEGIDAGVKVATLYGIPLITSQDVPKDGSSRLYALDTSDPEGYGTPRLSFATLAPTEYYESRDPIVVGKFAIRGIYRTTGEVIARTLKFNGKIRDLA